MAVSHNREKLFDAVGLTTVIDSKFKTNTMKIAFITDIKEETASANALASSILTLTNSKYKLPTELAAKLNMLYGAHLSSDTEKFGDSQILSVSANWIDNRFALEGEDIAAEMLDLILLCIFSPVIKNGAFEENAFAQRKRDLLDTIESAINNKRSYAVRQAAKHAFEGEPAAVSAYGTRESAEAVTSEQAVQAYYDILKKSQIEIYFVAPYENPMVKQRITEAFSKLERTPETSTLVNFSPIKPSVREVEEKMDVNQSKLVMVLKSASEERYTIEVMSKLLGGSPFSKLFANVREKMSLCYYCSASYGASKGVMYIDSGVEKKNVEKAKAAILEQLEDIKAGKFTDEELSDTIMYIENSFKSIGDTANSYIGWCFKRYCMNESITMPEQLEAYKSVTRDMVIEAAKSFTLDTVYIMNDKA